MDTNTTKTQSYLNTHNDNGTDIQEKNITDGNIGKFYL